ncbi:hypothetical protein B0H13DRAFT_2302445 [Mycena leptocephala]|nr:hypothetical protein B0H13DRAFT_2302445 [Mycena leptocephala]
MIALYAPPSRKNGKTAATLTSSKRQPDHECDPSNRVVQAPRMKQTHPRKRPSSPPSPASACSSPFPSPSALSSLPRATSPPAIIDLTSSLSPSRAPAARRIRSESPEITVKSEPTSSSHLSGSPVDTADNLWAMGEALVLPGFGT